MKPAKLDAFHAFAAAHPRKTGVPCSICSLPPDVLGVITQAWQEGYRAAHINGYLATLGYALSRNKIEHHSRNHVRAAK